MPEATTDSAKLVLVPIDLGSNRKGAVRVPGDVVKYFAIPAPAAGNEDMVTRTRAAYTRTVYKDMDDTVGKPVRVGVSTWKTPVRAAKGNVQGKMVKVPTERQTAKKNTRFVTLHFPASATVGAVSNWIFEKCVAHKPSYFIHNGNRYSVLRATGDVNPGEQAPAAG